MKLLARAAGEAENREEIFHKHRPPTVGEAKKMASEARHFLQTPPFPRHKKS